MKQYKARYAFLFEGKPREDDRLFEAPDPISAINQFHRFMQFPLGMGHKDYKLLSIHHLYFSERGPDGLRHPILSGVDLPNGPNPDLDKVMNAYDDPIEFGFVKEIDEEREVEFEKAHKS